MARYLILNIVYLTVAIAAARLLLPSWPPKKYLFSLAIILFTLMFIFNNYLAGRPIVEYRTDHILGIRLVYFPIEDLAYLILTVVLAPTLYEHFGKHNQ